MLLQPIILIVITSSYLIIAFLSYKSNPRNNVNKIFSLLTITIAFWSLFSFLEDEPVGLFFNSLFLRLDFSLGIITGFLVLFFGFYFPKTFYSIPRSVKILAFSATLALVVASFTDSVVYNVFFDKGIQFSNGILFPVYSLALASFFIAGVGVLIRKYRHLRGLERLQTKYLFFGVAISAVIAVAFNILVPNLLDVPPQTSRFGIYGTIFMMGAISYSILKHRLLDIEVIIRRSLVYSTLLAVLIGMYSLLVFAMNRVFLPGVSAGAFPRITDLIAIVLVAFTVEPLRRVIERATDKIFFKARYNAEETINRLSETLVSEIDLTELVREIKKVLKESLKVSKLSIYVKSDNHYFPVGIVNEFPQGLDNEIEKKHFITKYLGDHPNILVMEELERAMKEGKRLDPELTQAIKAFDKIGVEIVVPLLVKGELSGALFLGEKLSQDIYSNTDIRFLEILSHQAALSLENAKLYEEQKLYGVRLTKEVERATGDLRHANDRLKELDELKDEFMSIASHELRTPMTAIKSYVWLALHGKTQEKDPKVRTYLDKVFESSDRMIAMINDMLNVSRIETGRLQLDTIPISVWKVAEQVKDDLSARAAEAGVDVVIKREGFAPPVLADKDKLAEIFTNLIGNALKFTKPGGKVTVAAGKVGGMVEVSITDTGVGIAKENIGKLFKKYGKLSDSYATMSPTTGTGLGLYITKQYLQKMDGSISVKSILGKGATFTFSLPIATGKDLEKHERKEEQPTGVIINPKLAKTLDISKGAVKTEIGRTLSDKH